jgi:hypothetical protein
VTAHRFDEQEKRWIRDAIADARDAGAPEVLIAREVAECLRVRDEFTAIELAGHLHHWAAMQREAAERPTASPLRMPADFSR